MSLSAEAAAVEIRNTVYGFWNAGPPTQGVKFIFPDKEDGRPTDGTSPWAELAFSDSLSQVGGFAAEGQRRLYERFGTLTLAIYTPRGDGYTLGHSLARVVTEGLEAYCSSNGVIFRKVLAARIGRSGNYSQINVTAEYEYNESR